MSSLILWSLALVRPPLAPVAAAAIACHTSRALPPHRAAAAARRAHAPRMDYSTMVKITAENRAPLRQARIFFLSPSAIAGASIGAYVSLTRLVAGVSGFRSDVVPLNDGGNLLVDLGVVAAAVWALRADLRARDEQLEAISKELGEYKSGPEEGGSP